MTQHIDHTGDRPATRAIDEIEVTPEMIGAGIVALSKGDEAFESTEQIVIRIYREMEFRKMERTVSD